MICGVSGCEKKRHGGHPVCAMHESRMRLTGTYAPGPKAPPFEERLWSRIDKSAGPDACWPWMAATRKGYGVIMLNRKQIGTHRAAWELTNGPVPQGMVIDHKCHNPACCNPAHLHPVSQKQNIENHSGPSRANTSGVRGVYWHAGRGKWHATVHHHGRNHGRFFDTLEEAAAGVVEMRNRLHSNNLKDRVA